MSTPPKIKKFLDSAKVKYELLSHKTVYTAFDKAATLRMPLKTVAKTLIVSLDQQLVLVLIPANKNLDKNRLKKIAKVKKVDFVSEKVMKNKLKGAEVGAVPPFGMLWKIPTFVDRSLLLNKKILLSGGNYNWSISMTPAGYEKLVPDLIKGSFSKKR